MFYKNMKGDYRQRTEEIFGRFLSLLKKERAKKGHYDYSHFGLKKRKDITLSTIDAVKKSLKNIGDEAFIENCFIFSNSLILRGGYNDTVDYYGCLTMSAAIWILDQLSLQKKLEECYQFLPEVPDDCESDSFIFPYVSHPMYEYKLIVAMALLIRRRNTSKPFPDRLEGTILWEKDTPDPDPDSAKNRSAFDSVIALLDKEAVDRAVSNYEADVWRFYRISFQAYYRLERRITRLENELDEIENKNNGVFKPAQNNILSVFPKTDSDTLLKNLVPDGKRRSRANILESELEQLNGITLTQISLVNDREKAVRKLGGIIPAELGDEIIHFHVNDPYETAFALMYLLDTGSDIPWLYYGSISVAYTAIDQLPYDSLPSENDNPVLLSEWSDALYEHKYRGYRWPDATDAAEEPVQREYAKNLSQLLYLNSFAVFPRVVPEVNDISSYLEDLGELTPREKEAYSLLLYSLNAETLRAGSLDGFRLAADNEDDAGESLTDVSPDETIGSEALADEIKRLRDKNSSLLSLFKESKEQSRKSTNRISALNEIVERQRIELADLREKVFLLSQSDYKEEKEDKSIKYPYASHKKILSFGGHAPWINEMKRKLPSVVFVSPDIQPNADLIRAADEVWIQTNCLSHSSYYKIMDAVKGSGKQVRYYVYSGANKCADQIVKSCEQST